MEGKRGFCILFFNYPEYAVVGDQLSAWESGPPPTRRRGVLPHSFKASELVQDTSAMWVYGDTRPSVWRDSRPFLKNNVLNTREVQGIGGRQASDSSTHYNDTEGGFLIRHGSALLGRDGNKFLDQD
jgi:hypothetical protein